MKTQAGEDMGNRASWDEYFLNIAAKVAERSTCKRAYVGSIIVRDRSILATGYNGSPTGLPHCTEAGCIVYTSVDPNGDREVNCFRTVHSEINAISQAAKNGNSIENADIYITHSPCFHCLKSLINCSIRRVIYSVKYKLEKIETLAREANIELICINHKPLY